jgi:hypothetical protein
MPSATLDHMDRPGDQVTTSDAESAPRRVFRGVASVGVLLAALVIGGALMVWLVHPSLSGGGSVPNMFCTMPVDAVETLWVRQGPWDERCLVVIGSRTLATGVLLLALASVAFLLLLRTWLDRGLAKVPVIAFSGAIVAILIVAGWTLWPTVGRPGLPPSKDMVQRGFEQSRMNRASDGSYNWMWSVPGDNGRVWQCWAHRDALARPDFVQVGMYSCGRDPI